MAKNNALLVIILVVLGGFILYQSGALNLSLGGGDRVVVSDAPSDKKTSLTLNGRDALATTETNADVNYYVFTKDGSYVTGGSLSSGTATFDLTYGQKYDIVAFEDDDSGSDWLPEKVEVFADKSTKTVNMEFIKESTATISSVRDPIDLNGNISNTAGSTQSWEVLWSVTTSNAGIKNPILVIDYNSTSVDDLNVGGWAEITCPDKYTTGTERAKKCFQKAGTITSADGIISVTGSVLFDSTAGEDDSDYLEITIADTTASLSPNYIIEGISGVDLSAAEDSADADVGAADATAKIIEFGG